eukprot:934504-Amphidinium_carterae.1
MERRKTMRRPMARRIKRTWQTRWRRWIKVCDFHSMTPEQGTLNYTHVRAQWIIVFARLEDVRTNATKGARSALHISRFIACCCQQ